MLENLVQFVEGLVGGTGSSEVVGALGALAADASSLMTTVLPVGIGLMSIMAAPRIIKRIVHTFL